MGPILGEGQKRTKKPPERYGVFSIKATIVADLNDKEIRIIDNGEWGFEMLLAPGVVPRNKTEISITSMMKLTEVKPNGKECVIGY